MGPSNSSGGYGGGNMQPQGYRPQTYGGGYQNQLMQSAQSPYNANMGGMTDRSGGNWDRSGIMPGQGQATPGQVPNDQAFRTAFGMGGPTAQPQNGPSMRGGIFADPGQATGQPGGDGNWTPTKGTYAPLGGGMESFRDGGYTPGTVDTGQPRLVSDPAPGGSPPWLPPGQDPGRPPPFRPPGSPPWLPPTPPGTKPPWQPPRPQWGPGPMTNQFTNPYADPSTMYRGPQGY